MLMERIYKSFTKTYVVFLLQCCIILGYQTIITDSSYSSTQQTVNATSSFVPEQDGHHQRAHFTDQWAVHLHGGHEAANELAKRHGFENIGQILPDYYHFVHRKVAKRSVEPHHEYHAALSAEPEVHWHAQQIVKRRIKRDFLQLTGRPSSSTLNSNIGSSGGLNNRNRNLKSSTRGNLITFNDPRWPAMWYLNRGAGLDMNVQEAWAEGITGKGIVVTILDDGLEKDHPDIQQNYDPLASFDVNSLDNDPMPTYDLTDSNRHGTRCAGEVAAEGNNSMCAVGIAFEASVGGVRMLDGDVTDAVEARSLSHNPQHIDIYSASWGPDDDGKTVDGPGELATRAFLEGITKGRQGKGSIFVWASGNGGRDHDNCNCDGYTNSIWTLSISSATENGLVPWYSEACSSTLATTYSSGGTGERQIVTIDLHHSCTSSHTGTSASAPLAAGICALALQANTNLTWRDMQHIVVRTARPRNLIAPDWTTNGVGRNVSHSFGYGLMDAGAMVKLARNWITVPEQHKCEVRAPYSEKNIPAKSKVTLDLKVTDCPGVNLLEHVQAKVTLTSGRRGDLQIYLVSPHGTRSVLLAHRRHDLNRSGFTDWPFMSVHNWGENPLGKWTLEIHNEGRYADHKNGRTVMKKWSLILYGTEHDVNSNITPSSSSASLKEKGSKHNKDKLSEIDQANSTLTSTELSLSKNRSSLNLEDVGSKNIEESSSSNSPLEIGVPTIVRKPSRPRFRGKVVQKKTQKGVVNSEVLVGNNQSHTDEFSLCNKSDNLCTHNNADLNFVTTEASNISLTNSTPSSIVTEQAISFPTPDNQIENSNLFFSSTIPPTILPPALTTLTSSPIRLPHNSSNSTTGKLQTWAFIGHGITSNPNDVNPTKSENFPNEGSDKGNMESQTSGGGMEFDGSENKIVLEPSQVHRSQPVAVPSTPELSDNLDMASAPASSGGAGCLKTSRSMSSSGKCLECEDGLFLQDFTCVSSCSHNYYPAINSGSSGARICASCHYSCQTCFGSNESQCLSCYSDSTLRTSTRTIITPSDSIDLTDGSMTRDRNNNIKRKRDSQGTIQTTFKESHCYPTTLLSAIDGNELWYKALLMGVIVNITIVIFLLFYIWLQRQRDTGTNNINGEFMNDGVEGDSPTDTSSSWLSLNRKMYSRVSPHDLDDDDDHIVIAQNNRNNRRVSNEKIEYPDNLGNHSNDAEFKIAIPSLKTGRGSSRSYNNNSFSGRSKNLRSAVDNNDLNTTIPLNHMNSKMETLAHT